MSRRRDRKGLHVARGERYALIPREVLESEAYRSLPPWAVLVLLALAVQYYGSRNGSLALPWSDARKVGVRQRWHLFAGLRVLEAADLTLCTRRGQLMGGHPVASLYALTWRPIDDPAPGVTYDPGISVTVQPLHTWARWTRPDDWDQRVSDITRRTRGPGGFQRAEKNAESRLSGTGRRPMSGTGEPNTVPTRRVRQPSNTVPPCQVTSKILAGGTSDEVTR